MEIDWLPVTRFEQNCSILWCEETRAAAVVDPGGDLFRIEDYLTWDELRLELILITHGHLDHAGGAAELARRTGARIEGPHRGDEALIARLPEQGRKMGLKAESFIPDRWLEHGDTVRFGAQTIDVVHIPGHTSGHVAYVHAPSRFAWVGDTLFRHAIGAWEHPDGDLPSLVRSIRERLFPLGDDISFLPGHGETSTFGHERIDNPFVGEKAIEKRLATRR